MKTWYIPLLLVIAVGAFVMGRLFSLKPTPTPLAISQEKVLPSAGVELPVKWGDLGIQLIKLGVIDSTKFTPITDTGNIKITPANSREVLNSLWAFGLANKNPILETGPMVTYDNKQAGSPAEALAKAGNFASTGGWTIAVGPAMSHYSKHKLIVLTPDQQALVEKVSKNIYRPCCDNSTYFPDCNHGMAMLGLLQLLAANNVSESDMYKIALQVNTYWFPDTYLTLAKYFAAQNIPWDKVDPKEVLGATYSSSSGYRQILSKVQPAQQSGGGGCGV